MDVSAIRGFTLFLFLSIFHLSSINCRESYLWYDPVEVHIVNGLPDNTNSLLFRCQSKDDDLGYKTLLVGGDYYWTFHVNYLVSTLFFCHFYWQNKDLSFDVFNAKHHFPDCHRADDVHLCYWLAKEDGFYFSYYKADANSTDWKKLEFW